MNIVQKENARSKILSSAAIVFAKKSFDGARVDEIANMACVPKSLIYYHFKSKEEIYEVLAQEFLDAYEKLIDTYQEESNRHDPLGLRERMQTIYYQFGIENEALVRTILMDSFKKGNHNTTLFRMVTKIIQSKEEFSAEQKEHLLNEFFFNILPCMAYICLKDSWTQFFKIEGSDFDQSFLNAYSNTHGSYHQMKGEI